MSKIVRIGAAQDCITRCVCVETMKKIGFDGGCNNEDMWVLFSWSPETGGLEVDSVGQPELSLRHTTKLVTWLRTTRPSIKE